MHEDAAPFLGMAAAGFLSPQAAAAMDAVIRSTPEVRQAISPPVRMTAARAMPALGRLFPGLGLAALALLALEYAWKRYHSAPAAPPIVSGGFALTDQCTQPPDPNPRGAPYPYAWNTVSPAPWLKCFNGFEPSVHPIVPPPNAAQLEFVQPWGTDAARVRWRFGRPAWRVGSPAGDAMWYPPEQLATLPQAELEVGFAEALSAEDPWLDAVAGGALNRDGRNILRRVGQSEDGRREDRSRRLRPRWRDQAPPPEWAPQRLVEIPIDRRSVVEEKIVAPGVPPIGDLILEQVPDLGYLADQTVGFAGRPTDKTTLGLKTQLSISVKSRTLVRRLEANDHALARPRKRGKEIKLRLKSALVGRWLLVNAYTETSDFIKAVWHALPTSGPNRRRWGVTRLDTMIEDIVKNWKAINWAEAIFNLGANQVEDAFIGKVSKLVDRGSRGSGSGLSTQAFGGYGSDGWAQQLGDLVMSMPGDVADRLAVRWGVEQDAKDLRRRSGTATPFDPATLQALRDRRAAWNRANNLGAALTVRRIRDGLGL